MSRDHGIMKRIVEEAGECELCGSRRGLEAHHIIPKVCGGDESEDNLICVCRKCHSLLTPRSLLCKIGMRKNCALKEYNDKYFFYKTIKECCEEWDSYGTDALWDAIDIYWENWEVKKIQEGLRDE